MDLPPKSPSFARSPSAASHATSGHDQEDLNNNMRRVSLSQDRRASTSSNKGAASQSGPLTPNSARRSSSSFALRQSASSPRLSKRTSRSSLSAQSPHQPSDGVVKEPTPKRSISNLISGLREAQAQSSMAAIKEPVRVTAPDIAKVHFARELARLESIGAETMVILHDACYGHRFSRPRTSKSSLSMIVERPERLHAGVLGAATAFVRMGGHYEGQSNAPTVNGEVRDQPPFVIRKTARTLDVGSSFVTNVHGTAWMHELQGMCAAAEGRLKNGEKELARDSTTEEGEERTLHEGDLYLCAESLDAFQGALGGVADAVDAVFAHDVRTKRAFVAVRPPGHHCSADYPSGFCWLNNVHVGLEYAAQTQGLTHAAIIDFDLHHGDGSQSIAWDRNSKNNIKRITAKANSKLKLGPDIGYYSLHDINSYPCESGDDEKVQAASLCIENAHGQSIWNVHLQTWKTIDEFWQLYESRYKILLEKARIFLRHHTSRLCAEGKVQPKAAIFISAGFDASEWEGAGMQRHVVNVPTDFYARFTEDMVRLAQEEGTGCDGRVISVLEGGYSDRALCSGVLSHLSGLSSASSSAPAQPIDPSSDLEQHMSSLSLQNGAGRPGYDAQWWSAENLTALEAKVNPPPPPAATKKYRMGQQPTYATPTESFAYKVHDPQKFARSISGTMRETPVGSVRPPTPPSPEIDWVLATQELTGLLVPQDRQTKSCTPEQLAAPKKAAFAPSAADKDQAEKPRQLRTRAKPTQKESDRRRTIADLPVSTEPEPAAPAVPAAQPAQAKRSSRRSSMASTVSPDPTEADDIPPVPAIVTTTDGGMQPPPPPPAAPSQAQMKKVRAPPKLKKPVAPASAPVSPMFRRQLPSHAQGAAVPQGDEMQSPTATSAAPPASAMSPTSEMDALTKGLKKVTLKLGTREEHDRKMKEKLDAERRARALKGAETRRINKAAKEAKEAQMADAKLTPAQRAKLGPEGVRSENVKPAVPQEPVAILPKPEPEISQPLPPMEQNPMAGVSTMQGMADPEPQNNNASIMPTTSGAPQFIIPSYQAPAAAPIPAPAPAPAPPPAAAPEAPQPEVPVIQPQSATPPLPFPQSRQSSTGSIYRFVPVMNETTPPQSRPSTAARMTSSPKLNAPESSQFNPSAAILSGPAVLDRQLPVFSATGPIPFAAPPTGASAKEGVPPSGPLSGDASGMPGAVASQGHFNAGRLSHEAPAGVGPEADVDIWAVPETPKK